MFLSGNAHGGIHVRTSRLYILSVGINNYPSGSGLPKLTFAEADAAALGAAFAEWSGIPHSSVSTSVLVGEQATVASIREAMRRFALVGGPDDIFIFNFDGMGVCRNTNSNYSFAAYDTVTNADGTLRNALRAQDL